MTKEEVLEKMEEEKESVKSKILYGQSSNSSANGCDWCFDVINHAIDLVEQLDEPSAQKTSDIEIKNNLSYAGYADLAYNERVINGIESVLILLGYEVEDD
ncbi:hypothetical protein [Pediococcus pentosaceus]|uniref:hypothetical protein n=1 Tax=Pediococcus pentosaceus TaxID=1255 RepID=UPI0022E7BCCB|nr:hypothetical protein [Pediococcus pentosaceus]